MFFQLALSLNLFMFYFRISILFAFVMYLLTFSVRNNIFVSVVNVPFFGQFINVSLIVVVLIAVLCGMTLQYLISLFTKSKKK